MHERAPPLPIFRGTLAVEYQRVGLGPLADRVRPAAQLIRALGIGEREAVGGVVVVLVLLTRRHDDVGEAVVHPHAPAAGDVRQHAVEYLAPGRIGVEAAVNRIADAAPRLRAAEGVGHLHRPAVGHRIGAVLAVEILVLQETHEVAHRHVAQAQNERIAAFVDELIDPTGLEPARHMDVSVGLDNRLLGALEIEARAGLDAREPPCIRRNLDALVVGVAAPRQPGLRGIA